MKARAHAKKHRLSEAEFAEFQRIYEQELAGGNSPEVLIPVTNMMKVLGNVTPGADSHFRVDDADGRNLQEILKLNEMTRPLHAQVLLQAIQYQDMDPNAISNSVFNKDVHNVVDHVHPVIAALFLPKIKTLDEHFLYSNISGIVKTRYNHQPLTTRPDYELLYSLITDPNDVVCDTRTPVADLLHRANLQNQLWNSVLHLRNGQCFNPSLREFMGSVDVCRLNKYDNPDFVYGRHDGTILKRLFAAFSFRPTVVATLPVANLFSYNPYSQNLRPTVTSIPMINVRLSNFANQAAQAAQAQGLNVPNVPSTLKDALTQTNQFIEGNVIVNRHTSVMYSREVLVFYVDRRSYAYELSRSVYNVVRLPTSIAGFERINDVPLTIEAEIPVGGDTFSFVSAIVAEVNTTVNTDKANYVVGSSALLYGSTDQGYLEYKPSKCITENLISPIQPISQAEFEDKLEKQGIIYIYQNVDHRDDAREVLNI